MAYALTTTTGTLDRRRSISRKSSVPTHSRHGKFGHLDVDRLLVEDLWAWPVRHPTRASLPPLLPISRS